MRFENAILVVKDGGMISRGDWDDDEAHVSLVRDQLHIIKKNDKYRPWLITIEDLEADDWEVFIKNPLTSTN